MAKIFITGVTGFLGSNIAAYLIDKGHTVLATYRATSNREICLGYEDKVIWILQTDDNAWINKVIDHRPEIVIHGAWIGVSLVERNNWDIQFQNVEFLRNILFIVRESGARKFIGLGSRAEYGLCNGHIDETYPISAIDAYGCVKIICSEIVKQHCDHHMIDWYWLRLFSFFGKGESETWLISSLIKNINLSDEMDLTAGEQRYSYLYAEDLGLAVSLIIGHEGNSGIYNIAGKKLITLRSFIEGVRDKIAPNFRLNFGKLPYRAGQPMLIDGDPSKFVNVFGEFEVSNFDEALFDTISFLKRRFEKAS